MSFVLVALLALATGFAMHHEGYVPLVRPLLGGSILAGLAVAAWLAATERRARLAALLFVIFAVEYVKESIGIRAGLWAYHGEGGQYVFGVWLWVIAGTAVYGLAKKVAAPLLGRVLPSPPRWVNAAAVIAVAAIVPATLGADGAGTGVAFAAFYVAAAAGAAAASLRMTFAAVVSLVVTAWLVGNASEYAGAIGSGAWTFPRHPRYPPVYLLFGCWPIEIVVQVALSALVASEPLDLSPAAPAEEGP